MISVGVGSREKEKGRAMKEDGEDQRERGKCRYHCRHHALSIHYIAPNAVSDK